MVRFQTSQQLDALNASLAACECKGCSWERSQKKRSFFLPAEAKDCIAAFCTRSSGKPKNQTAFEQHLEHDLAPKLANKNHSAPEVLWKNGGNHLPLQFINNRKQLLGMAETIHDEEQTWTCFSPLARQPLHLAQKTKRPSWRKLQEFLHPPSPPTPRPFHARSHSDHSFGTAGWQA